MIYKVLLMILFLSNKAHSNQNGLCPVAPLDAEMFSDLLKTKFLPEAKCLIKATNITKERCIANDDHCRCSADYKYGEETYAQRYIEGLPMPDHCQKIYTTLCEEGFNGKRNFLFPRKFDKSEFQKVVNLPREIFLDYKKVFGEEFYFNDRVKCEEKIFKQEFCKGKERDAGKISGDALVGLLLDPPDCKIEGTLSPSQVPCKNLLAPEECKNKKIVYHSESLCNPSVFLGSGKFKLTIHPKIDDKEFKDKEKRYVTCDLIYQAPNISLSLGAGPQGMTCGDLRSLKYSVDSPVSRSASLSKEMGYPGDVLAKKCTRLEDKLKKAPAVLKEYSIDIRTRKYWQWAQIDTLRNYTDEGWGRFVKLETEECTKELINGQSVDRTPTQEQDLKAKKYFDSQVQAELNKLSNPNHTWVCCKT